MEKVIKAVKHNDRWHFDMTDEAKALYDRKMSEEGRVKIVEKYQVGSGSDSKREKIIYYLPIEVCLEVRGTWKRKVDVIMDEFGEKEWMERLRIELGIENSEGIAGVNKIMKSTESRERYKKLRDEVAQLAKTRIEARYI